MNADEACINDETSETEVSETDPATESVNPDDSSLCTSVQQPGSETVTHPQQPQ